MATRSTLIVTAVAALLAVAGCTADSQDDDAARYQRILHFDTAHVRVASATDTTQLTVELALSDQQHTLGLMERRHLDADAGMLFVYPVTQPATGSFWMYRTRIPLDIAFVDSTGTIRSIRTMQPCAAVLTQGCPDYPPGVPYRAALEVNAGFFAQHRYAVGDRVLLADTVVRR